MAINGYRIRYKVGTVVRSSFHCCVVFGSSFAGAPGGRGDIESLCPRLKNSFLVWGKMVLFCIALGRTHMSKQPDSQEGGDVTARSSFSPLCRYTRLQFL